MVSLQTPSQPERSSQAKILFRTGCHPTLSVRELQRQIEGTLFERVALSGSIRKLVALEKNVQQ